MSLLERQPSSVAVGMVVLRFQCCFIVFHVFSAFIIFSLFFIFAYSISFSFFFLFFYIVALLLHIVACLLLHVASYPGALPGLNHYVPVWSKDSLDAETISKLATSPADEMESLKTVLSEERMPGQFWLKMQEDARERMKALERWCQMQAWLASHGLVASEVPGDGNCGVWSFLQFMTGNATLRSHECKDSCQQLREQIAKAWLTVKDDLRWHACFEHFVATFDRSNGGNLQAEVKAELHQTPKRKGPALPGFVDLSTPPKRETHETEEQKGASAVVDVVAVGAQRTACPMKQPLGEEDGRTARRVLRSCLENSEAFGTPKRSKKKKAVEEPAKQEGEDEEQEQGGQGKAKRHRMHKKKEKTEEERRQDAVQTYLASLGITWGFHQTFHAKSRTFGVKKCNQFSILQQGLLECKMPECQCCVDMLKRCNFDMGDLQTILKNMNSEGCPSPAMERWRHLQKKLQVEEALPLQGDTATEEDQSAVQVEPVMNGEDGEDGEGEEHTEEHEATEQEQDVFAIVKQNQFLQLLPFDTHDRRIPIRCKVCRTKKQPEGKIFEGNEAKKNSIDHFVKQHCRRPTHLAALGRVLGEAPTEDTADSESDSERCQCPCHGYSLSTDPKYEEFRTELATWARLTRLSRLFGKHKYIFSVATEELTVFHDNCVGVVMAKPNSGRVMCDECAHLNVASSAVKSAIRFRVKYWAAQYFQAKLFKSPGIAESIVQQMKDSSLCRIHPARIDEVLNMPDSKLQTYLRSSWLKLPKELCTEQLSAFIEETVRSLICIDEF